jgi:outer membrane protein insertion porin family
MNQSLFRHLTILFFLFCFSIQAQESVSQSYTLFSHNTIDKEAIKHCCNDNILIENITFESDVVFDQEEFLHLLGFKPGDTIQREDINKAVERCIKKSKFCAIKMRVNTGEIGTHLHFVFESVWTFKKIKIHHVYQGKHLLTQFYLMERGDLFDESKHAHSLTKIKDYLTHNGYLDRQVTSSLEYDQKTKEVIAHISVKKGKRYAFGSVDIEIVCEEGTNQESDNIRSSVRKKIVHVLSSQPFTKDLLTKQVRMLKDYLAKKGFLHSAIDIEEDIDPRRAFVNVTLKLTIHQKRKIVFFGERFFSKKQLLDKILAFGQSVWLLPATLLAEEIIREYKNKGFLQVEVTAQEEKERSFFVIKEGLRAIIKNVEVKNAPHADYAAIKKQCFGKLLKHEYYDAQLCEEAISCLNHFYADRGFISFVVIDHECVPTRDNEYTLVVTVDEGKRKYIADVFVEGHPQLSDNDPFRKSNFIDKNIVFDVKILENQRAWLVKHFQSLGYMHPRLKPIIESDDDTVVIKWTVELGEQARFGKTIVQGSSAFPFSYIERFLFYQEGQLWDQAQIKRSFRALKDLEIFETIHFLPDYRDTTEEKSVLLKLHLDDRYEIRTRAGLELQHVRKYQTFSGVTYKLGGTALIKNPTNAGDQLRFDCDFTRSHREIVGKYRRPWFVTNPFFTTFQVYSIVYDQPGFRVNSSVNDVYTLIQNGFLVGLQKKNQYIDVGWNNGCEWMKLHIKDEQKLSFALAIDFEPRLIDKTVPFFFTEPTIMLERLDNPLNPTRGGVGLFSLKMMVPLLKKYKHSFFLKVLFEQSFFVPLQSVVAAVRFRCGHIFYREFSGIMPSERFYLGGSHSLRGYEADLAPPLGVFVDDEGKERVVPRGGRTMVNANVELRFPVWRKIGGVIFQDLGALSGKMFADFRTQDLLAASGFGLRIFTPLGPLRFDIGWRWHKQLPIERSFAWFLTFGQAF